MITKVPESYILFHEICDIMIGPNCEKVSNDYLLSNDEKKLQSLLSEESKLRAAERKVGAQLSTKYIGIEQSIDSLGMYRQSLLNKLRIHDLVRISFYEAINRYGIWGDIKTLLLKADGNLFPLAARSFYGSDVDYESACEDSEGRTIITTEDNPQQIIECGHVILKKNNLITLQQPILVELQEKKDQYESTEEDWKNIKFKTVIFAGSENDKPDKSKASYSGIPGRPTSWDHIVKPHFEERMKNRKCEPSLTKESEYLCDWLKEEHPGEHQLKKTSLANTIRVQYKKYKFSLMQKSSS